MAIVTRYFSTAAAGAGDGTTWADRAVLFTAGAWSAVITGFDFSGSDSLKCLVGPGTSTITVALAAALFANPPTAANPMAIHGCDSSGNQLTPPDPDWRSCDPEWDDSGLPVLATTTNIITTSLPQCLWRLVKLTASGRTGGAVVTDCRGFDWGVIENSSNNASTGAWATASATCHILNSVVTNTGAAYNYGINLFSAAASAVNCRVVGNAGTSGNRRGIDFSGASAGVVSRCTVLDNGGSGVAMSSVSAAAILHIFESVIANNDGSGVLLPSTASQTGVSIINRCMITGNGAYGIDGQSAARVYALNNRLRDNTSGNLNGFGNYPTDFGNYTTDSDDASEYVDSGAGDFQIKSSSTIAGMGFGVSEQAPAGGGGGAPVITGPPLIL